ncbi:glycerophosphoryl diester phosphodiesterase membrane domain-containing protein [Haloarcula sp. CBA1127]|uniref:glycerophosphoryl diester phosphodiesterase membrane domain-containing protein n=1 Tax=Haloarcula sp. CBA1127 TaxID=1765055 RepID=UPI00073E4FD5|nr:glycerophosphoryl diester phosphodiesterase membrane domain-containing protein [Haloarcula sp. CBA1127]
MALQIGSALEEAGYRLFSRTGAILLVAYFALMASFQVLFNSAIATTYARMGYGEIAAAMPLSFDIPLTVVGAGIAVSSVVSLYLTVVSFRTFVAGARTSFPEGAFTRNVPLALVNVFVGGIVYSLLVFIGTVFLIIPGIFAYVAFIFMMPYIIVEDRNFIAALKESYRLTEGDRLALFGLLLIVGAAAAVVGGIIGFVGSLALSGPVSQLPAIVIQPLASLYGSAIIAVAFEQLRTADGRSPSAPSEDDTTMTAL